MAHANVSSPLRDIHIDSDTTSARKRRKLDNSSSPSSQDSVVVLALESEQDDPGLFDELLLHSPTIKMDNYSSSFPNFGPVTASPEQSLRHLHAIIEHNGCIAGSALLSLGNWLNRHLDSTETSVQDWPYHYLQLDADFFTQFATVAIDLLDEPQPIGETTSHLNHRMRIAFQHFFHGLLRLSRRIIILLPDVLESVLSRRDSGQSSNKQHEIPLLVYISLATRTLSMMTPAVQFYYSAIVLNDPKAPPHCALLDANCETLDCTAELVKTLSSKATTIRNGWIALIDAIRLASYPLGNLSRDHLRARAATEDILHALNTVVLPAISEKHSQALPPGFHTDALFVGKEAVHFITSSGDLNSVLHSYNLLIKGDDDALLACPGDPIAVLTSLDATCRQYSCDLAHLISICWSLKQTDSFLRSDVMNVRSIGLELCGQKLQSILDMHKTSLTDLENPFIQYAVRFLRQTEFVKYVFGAESHATIVFNSATIIGFLASTRNYTDIETDIIWEACSTNVEADFVNASFRVLESTAIDLDFERLLYIANKYHSTPASKLGVDAVNFLHRLFHYIREKLSRQHNHCAHLAVAHSAVQILKTAQQEPLVSTSAQLWSFARTEIEKSCSTSDSQSVRQEICRRCTKILIERTEDATLAVEVLHIILNTLTSPVQKQSLLEPLPLAAAIRELCTFVDKQRHAAQPQIVISNIVERLMLIIHIIDIDPSKLDRQISKQLFDVAFGDRALNNIARDRAWGQLCMLASRASLHSTELMDTCLDIHVPHLPIAFATPNLVHAMGSRIRSLCHVSEPRSNNLASMISWKILVGFSRLSQDAAVVATTKHVIAELLNPGTVHKDQNADINDEDRAAAVRDLTEKLSREAAELNDLNSAEYKQRISRGIDVLDAIITQSIIEASVLRQALDPIEIVVGIESGSITDQMSFTARLWCPDSAPRMMSIRISTSASLSELLDKIKVVTGAHKHVMVVNGIEVTKNPLEVTIDRLDITPSSVVLVMPRFTFSHNLSFAFKAPSIIHVEVNKQQHLLERFLDSQDDIAAKAFSTLVKGVTCPKILESIADPSADITTVFPVDRKWRCMFSTHILARHLHDSRRLGLADSMYISHGIRLLTRLITDNHHTSDRQLMHRLLLTLWEFLQERPNDSEALNYFDDCSSLVSSLCNLLRTLKDESVDQIQTPRPMHLRTEMVKITYRVLTEAFGVDHSAWIAFSSDDDCVLLHRHLLFDQDATLPAVVARAIDDFALRTPDQEIIHSFWAIIVQALPDALSTEYSPDCYFELATNMLARDLKLQSDQNEMLELINSLSDLLLAQSHTEDMSFVIPDKAMIGVLRMLQIALQLRKNQKDDQQDDQSLSEISTKIFHKFLFPPRSERSLPPLVHSTSRDLAYDIVKLCLKNGDHLTEILKTTQQAIEIPPRGPKMSFPGHEAWIRQARQCSGLTNLGMTCYMNSLMQQLFANLHFRKFILEIRHENPRPLLLQLQKLFASMQESVRPWIDTQDLADALGVIVGNQEDVHGFYAILMAQLEECMPDQNSRLALQSFFSGTSITQIRGECGHVSSCTETFSDLSITVNNVASLSESLSEFVQGEPMAGANKYKCMTCDPDSGGRLVNALRRTCLERIPPTLTFCLKRFTFDFGTDGENKVNARFEFPGEIDMNVYSGAYLENPEQRHNPDVFELVGVIVHQGSLTFGHYWSYIRLPDASCEGRHHWVIVEDTKAIPCPGGLAEVQEQCFGGTLPNNLERIDNAYVLFYQRKSYIAEASSLAVQTQVHYFPGLNPPRIPLTLELSEEIYRDNIWRRRVSFCFEESFSNFVQALIDKYVNLISSSTVSASTSAETREFAEQSLRAAHSIRTTTQFTLAYLWHILAADPELNSKLECFMESVDKLLVAVPGVALEMIQLIAGDKLSMESIILSPKLHYRNAINMIIERCLRVIKRNIPDDYDTCFMQIIDAHLFFRPNAENGLYSHFAVYLELPYQLTKLGRVETRLLLDSGYLELVLDALNAHRADTQGRNLPMACWVEKYKPDYIALFYFLHNILAEQVDWNEISLSSDKTVDRNSTEKSWGLKNSELRQLFSQTVDSGQQYLTICLLAVRYCNSPPDVHWTTFTPGQFIGHLVGQIEDEAKLAAIKNSMLRLYDLEDRQLRNLLVTTLHICANMADSELHEPLRVLAENLVLWEGHEKISLWFLEQAYSMTPISILATIPVWALRFLKAKQVNDRKATVNWLSRILFDPTPLSENHIQDAARSYVTRRLVQGFIESLTTSFQRGQHKSSWRFLLQVLSHAQAYLETFLEEVRSRMIDVDAAEPVAQELRIESDEALATHGLLSDFLREVERSTDLIGNDGFGRVDAQTLEEVEIEEENQSPTTSADEDSSFDEMME